MLVETWSKCLLIILPDSVCKTVFCAPCRTCQAVFFVPVEPTEQYLGAENLSQKNCQKPSQKSGKNLAKALVQIRKAILQDL